MRLAGRATRSRRIRTQERFSSGICSAFSWATSKSKGKTVKIAFKMIYHAGTRSGFDFFMQQLEKFPPPDIEPRGRSHLKAWENLPLHVCQVLQEGFLESNYALTSPELIICGNGQLCPAGTALHKHPRRVAGTSPGVLNRQEIASVW